jgi:multidrug resistance efflux pump
VRNFVRVGDTIGFFYSNEVEYQLARLRGLLDVEKATLKFYMTGEKEAVVEQVRRKLEGAREQMEAQRKIFERAKALYEKNLISAQEFELAQSTLKLYEANVEIAEAELQNVMTGAKGEQIKLIEANIRAIQEQINVLEKRAKSSVLTTPISGVISGYFSQDTILAVMDTSKFIILLPIKLLDTQIVKPGHTVEIKNQESLTAMVKGSHNRVEILNGEQVVFYIAESKDKIVNLKPGAIVTCYVKIGKVNLIEFVTKFIKTGFRL